MARVAEILGLAASVVVLLTFFFRAWANLRRGKRLEAYPRTVGESADLELERLRAEQEELLRRKADGFQTTRPWQTVREASIQIQRATYEVIAKQKLAPNLQVVAIPSESIFNTTSLFGAPGAKP